MLSQERKSELLEHIKDEFAGFLVVKSELEKCWSRRAAHISKIKRDIMCLTHGEARVKQIESLVGQRIMQVDDDSAIILLVKGIEFRKWDIRFYGDGIGIDVSGRSWRSSQFDIEYNEFASENDDPQKPEPVTVVTEMGIDRIIGQIEATRDAKIASYCDKVKNCGTEPDKNAKAKKHLKFKNAKAPDETDDMREEQDDMYDETGFRMEDLVRWFGPGGDKAYRPGSPDKAGQPDDLLGVLPGFH